MQSKRLQIALIGLGHVAPYQVEVLSANPAWKIVGAADLKRENAAILPVGVPFYLSSQALLEDTRADVCLVATNPATHFEIGKQVLDSGRDLILEKPCCVTLDQFLQLIDLAKMWRRRIFVALHAAYALDLQWFLAHRNSLALGKLTGFQCRFYDPYVENHVLREAGRSLGGSWLDSGINALSVIASIVPPSVLSVTAAQFDNMSVAGCTDIQSIVDIRLGELARGSIETHWALGLDSKSTLLQFAQTDAEVFLDHSNESVSIYRAGSLTGNINLRNGKNRLVNHYAGVFSDACHWLKVPNERHDGDTNIEFSLALHRLLFMALDLQKYPHAN